MSYCQSLAPINHFTTVAHTREICLAKLVIKSSSVSLGLTVCVMVSWRNKPPSSFVCRMLWCYYFSWPKQHTNIQTDWKECQNVCVHMPLLCPSLAPRPVCGVWGNETGESWGQGGTITSIEMRQFYSSRFALNWTTYVSLLTYWFDWIIFVWIYNSSLPRRVHIMTVVVQPHSRGRIVVIIPKYSSKCHQPIAFPCTCCDVISNEQLLWLPWEICFTNTVSKW